MSQFIITYIGGNQPKTPEEGMKHMAAYKVWLAALGEAAVSPANPMKNTHTINPDGTVVEGGNTAMNGYTIVEAGSYDDAVEMAKGCPFLAIGGSLEVSELMKMPF